MEILVSNTSQQGTKEVEHEKSKENPSMKQQRAYRPTYERFFLPLGIFFSKFMSANQVSYLGVVFSIISLILFFFSQNGNYIFIYLALLFMGVSALMDMIDGSVARAEQVKGKKIGKYGALLDPVADRYAEIFFLMGIMLSRYSPPEWVLFAFAGMIMASYTRACGESLGPDKDGNKLFISVGIERKEKLLILVFGAIIEALLFQTKNESIWPYFNYGDFLIGPIAWSVVIVAILSHLAAFQRLKLAQKYLVELE